MKAYLPLLPLLLYVGASQASCGSSFCSVNTQWDVQGLAHDNGLLLDLRYAFSKADRYLAGASRKTPESPSGSNSEIENGRTVNEVLNLAGDYAFDARWAATINLPLIRRDHLHTFDSADSGPIAQQAKFTALGDVRVIGRYAFASHANVGGGMRLGVKLPTGATDKIMTPPDPADPATPYKLERSSQPGTGSTDAIVGAYVYGNSPSGDWGWFANAQYQAPMAIKDEYRPGRELAVDLGVHRELTQGISALLQLNGLTRQRDSGANANPASGGYSWHLSPGFSYALTPASRIYGFLQLPVKQYKNTDAADPGSGQLAARWSVAIGVTQRF